MKVFFRRYNIVVIEVECSISAIWLDRVPIMFITNRIDSGISAPSLTMLLSHRKDGARRYGDGVGVITLPSPDSYKYSSVFEMRLASAFLNH